MRFRFVLLFAVIVFGGLSVSADCCQTIGDAAGCGSIEGDPGGTGGGGSGGGGGGGDPYAFISGLPRAGESPTKLMVYLALEGEYQVPYAINYKGFVRYDYDWPPDVTSHVYSVYETHLWVAVGAEGPFNWDLRQRADVRYEAYTLTAFDNPPCSEPCYIPAPVYLPEWPGIAARFTEEYGNRADMYGRLWTSARVLNGLNPSGTEYTWEHQIRWNED